MVGLILAWALPLLAAPQRAGQEPGPHLARVVELLTAPRVEDAAWRGMLFQSLARLDHAPAPQVRAGWQALAASGLDSDLSNRILYFRRQGLPLPATALGEGVDSALERALAAWGEGAVQECGRLLRASVAAWPADPRAAANLLWLERRSPPALTAREDARGCALAVLAARGAIP